MISSCTSEVFISYARKSHKSLVSNQVSLYWHSALTETCLAGKVSTELAHDITVTLASKLLSDGLEVFFHKDGEGRGCAGI